LDSQIIASTISCMISFLRTYISTCLYFILASPSFFIVLSYSYFCLIDFSFSEIYNYYFCFIYSFGTYSMYDWYTISGIYWICYLTRSYPHTFLTIGTYWIIVFSPVSLGYFINYDSLISSFLGLGVSSFYGYYIT